MGSGREVKNTELEKENVRQFVTSKLYEQVLSLISSTCVEHKFALDEQPTISAGDTIDGQIYAEGGYMLVRRIDGFVLRYAVQPQS